MLQAELLQNIPHIDHGFFGRQGGNSTGIYASLNCGAFLNDPQSYGNREIVATRMGIPPAQLLSVSQVHGKDVSIIQKSTTLDESKQQNHDAMVTQIPNHGLGILTADCVPVLFADKTAPIIGAAHAGWRGALGGVLQETLDQMQKLGSQTSNIVAAIGPAIQQESYEVGAEVRDAFLEKNAQNDQFFVASPQQNHYMLDVPSFVEATLKEYGIGDIQKLTHDTYTNEADFFSYRRMTHQGQADYGRQISVITLKEG